MRWSASPSSSYPSEVFSTIKGLISSGWASQEVVERLEGHYEVQEIAFDRLLAMGLKRNGVAAVGGLLILASLLIIMLVALDLIPG